MTTSTIRCSDWSRAASLSPVGTSGSYAGYPPVEIPLPWPRDAGDTAEGAALGPIIGPLGRSETEWAVTAVHRR